VYDWAEPYADTARRRAPDIWTAIAELLEPGEPDQALAALDTALSHDPYNEYLYQRIMRIQAAAGRPDAVRRTLRLLETRLTELGLTPPKPARPPPPSSVRPGPRNAAALSHPCLRGQRPPPASSRPAAPPGDPVPGPPARGASRPQTRNHAQSPVTMTAPPGAQFTARKPSSRARSPGPAASRPAILPGFLSAS
jgi:hypothetical protein